jgi:hypothetical protein
VNTDPQEQTITLPRCRLNDCEGKILIMGQNLIPTCPRCPPPEEPGTEAPKRLLELLFDE